MPILIDELLVEAEPPRSAASEHGSKAETQDKKPGQADKLLELSIVADRGRRLEVD